MAKALLVRHGKDEEFQIKRLELREIGFSTDLEKLYIGGLDKNLYIPDEDAVKKLISDSIANTTIRSSTSASLAETFPSNSMAINSETGKLLVKIGGEEKRVIMASDTIGRNQINHVVLSEHIDADGSVSLASFTRPILMIFIDGILCLSSSTAEKRFTYDEATQLLKVYGASQGSVISYY